MLLSICYISTCHTNDNTSVTLLISANSLSVANQGNSFSSRHQRIVGENRNIIRVVTATKSSHPDTGIQVVFPRVRVRVRVHSKTGTSRVGYNGCGSGQLVKIREPAQPYVCTTVYI